VNEDEIVKKEAQEKERREIQLKEEQWKCFHDGRVYSNLTLALADDVRYKG
jgi:hypothetical protein